MNLSDAVLSEVQVSQCGQRQKAGLDGLQAAANDVERFERVASRLDALQIRGLRADQSQRDQIVHSRQGTHVWNPGECDIDRGQAPDVSFAPSDVFQLIQQRVVSVLR